MIDGHLFVGCTLWRIFFRLWAPHLKQKQVYKGKKWSPSWKLGKLRHDYSKPLLPSK